MQVFPISFFEDRIFSVDPKLCFLLMPYGEPWSGRVHAILKDVVERAGYILKRVDDLYGRIVLSDIWEQINRAAFVIADLTGNNPNVYYELGIAHVLGKEIIPLLQRGHEIPFDQKPFRILLYEDNLDGRVLLERELANWINSLTFSSSPQMLVLHQRVEDFNAWRQKGKPVRFVGAEFKDLILNGINFSSCVLTESSFAASRLEDSDLSGANLIRADLSGCSLARSNLRLANLSEANLGSASLENAILRDAILLRANLRGSDLTAADVSGLTIDYRTHERFASVFESARNPKEIVVER